MNSVRDEEDVKSANGRLFFIDLSQLTTILIYVFLRIRTWSICALLRTLSVSFLNLIRSHCIKTQSVQAKTVFCKQTRNSFSSFDINVWKPAYTGELEIPSFRSERVVFDFLPKMLPLNFTSSRQKVAVASNSLSFSFFSLTRFPNTLSTGKLNGPERSK